MGNTNDAAIEQLAADWPGWEFWVVKRLCGGPLYCCRRHDDHGQGLRADSPGQLAEALEDTVSEPIDHGWVSGTSGTEEIPVMDMPMTGDLLRETYRDWTIALNESLGVWTAEQATGSEVRYLVARRAWELAAKIEQAERDEKS
jgi:hypothetical protein